MRALQVMLKGLSIQVSIANFTVAWQIIYDRFANDQLLVYNHIKIIFNLKLIASNIN